MCLVMFRLYFSLLYTYMYASLCLCTMFAQIIYAPGYVHVILVILMFVYNVLHKLYAPGYDYAILHFMRNMKMGHTKRTESHTRKKSTMTGNGPLLSLRIMS